MGPVARLAPKPEARVIAHLDFDIACHAYGKNGERCDRPARYAASMICDLCEVVADAYLCELDFAVLVAGRMIDTDPCRGPIVLITVVRL